MKNIRTILGLLIVAFSGICSHLSAQQTLRVYKHDGKMEVFFYSNLDSITFSNVDDSGITQDFVVTQNFHTADSIYRFPVSEIDSVAFSSIPTVYKSNAVRIDGQLRDYVIGADSLTLYLKKSIPDALLPKVGDNIATLECDEVLPYGFFGKVEKITHEVTSINVECTQASLIDIFDSLGLEGSATTESPSVHSRSPFDTWPPKHYNLTIPSLKGFINLSQEIDEGDGFSDSYNMGASIGFSTEKCDIYWAFFITPMAYQFPHVYSSLTYTAQNTLSIEASLSAGIKWENEFPLEAIRNIRIPGAAAVFEFFEEGGIFIEIEGKIGLNGSLSKPFTTVLHFSSDNKAESTIPPTFRMIGRDAVIKATLEGEAAISVGLYGKIGVAPLIKEMADIEAELKAGATFSSSRSLTPAATPIEILNTEMYDEMNRDDFFRGDFTLTGEVTAKILNDTKLTRGLEIGDLFVKNPFFTRGIVPHFDEVSLTESDRAGVLSAKATLSRKLMFNTPVGFALYDDEKKLVDRWWSPTEYKDKEGTTLSHDFEGLSTNKEYTLHPITKVFKDNMVANPSSNAKIVPAVSSGEATAITHNSATLHGTVENVGENDDYTYGFYWYSTSKVEAETGTFIPSTVNNGGTFYAQLDNLQPETTYYYRACATINGETLLADNIQSFTTEKEEDETENPKEDETIKNYISHDIYVTPESAFLVLLNPSENAPLVTVSLYSDIDMTNQLTPATTCLSIVICIDGFRGRACAGFENCVVFNKLKPSSSYYYKIHVYDGASFKDVSSGTFTTPSDEIYVTTPEAYFDPTQISTHRINTPIYNEYFEVIGYRIESGDVIFKKPMVSGISEELSKMLSSVCNIEINGHSIGIIYADSPDNLTWGNPLETPYTDYSDSFLKPGTYYYRAYYTNTSAYEVLTKDDGSQVIVDSDGEEIGPNNSDTQVKIKNLCTVYGEIKQFTIPEEYYY